MVVYVTFLRDVACQKLLNYANVSRSYSQNNTDTVFWDTVYVVTILVPTREQFWDIFNQFSDHFSIGLKSN